MNKLIYSKKNVIKNSTADKVFYTFNTIILAICGLIVLLPLMYIVACSFSSGSALLAGDIYFWPKNFTFSSYIAAFNYPFIWRGYLNSIIYTSIIMIGATAMTVIAAYPCSVRNFSGSRVFMFLIFFTMIFSGGIIPTYLIMNSLGLYNNPLALILPGLMSGWNVVITRTYFQNSLSEEIRNATKIDGCDDFKFILHFVVPLSKAIIAVNLVYYAVGNWNAYFNALLYISDEKYYPLQLVLRQILIMNSYDSSMLQSAAGISHVSDLVELSEQIQYSVIILASVPMLILYPLAQKYFVQGVLIGAVKE